MYQKKRIAVIVAAAGSGTRMGSGISKQFLWIGNQMVVERSMDAFEGHPWIDDIFLVVKPEDRQNYPQAFSRFHRFLKLRKIVDGGLQRQDSVGLALEAIEETEMKSPVDIVLIHDAARPFVSREVIDRVVEASVTHGAAIPGIPINDTIKRKKEFWIEETLDRDGLTAVQTPQGFQREIIIAAHRKAEKNGWKASDDAALVEDCGTRVRLVEGDIKNQKITTRHDLPAQGEWRTGHGFDVHRFSPGKDLVLGGVLIPFEKRLQGHSDADVLTHAIIDALLGASGLGDIGGMFPDSEEAYRGISSLTLLERVIERMRKVGFTARAIDGTLIGEKPRIGPYAEEIRYQIASVIGVCPDAINIKGTTTETLGFCGREEGLAAMATATVYRENQSSDSRRNVIDENV